MHLKPFRPPLLKKPVNSNASEQSQSVEPPLKKRRITPEPDAENNVRPLPTIAAARPPPLLPAQPRKPLNQAAPSSATQIQADAPATDSDAIEGYYNVVWRKPTNKKHKGWDGDAVLSLRNGLAQLQDLSGKDMGRLKRDDALHVGNTLTVSGKHIQIESIMTKEEWRRSFPAAKPTVKIAPPQPPPTTANRLQSLPSSSVSLGASNIQRPSKSLEKKIENIKDPKVINLDEDLPGYKNPLKDKSTLMTGNKNAPKPRHNPNTPGALVMRKFPSQGGREVIDVVVDPLLSERLRPHQREGVSFMYECVMGLRGSFEGAILADEMGLGKSLQVVTLLWTLFMQNPIHNAGPVIRKAVIVCPATLVGNWRIEIRKWLGKNRIGVFCADDADARIKNFLKGRSYHVCILSYEKLTRVQDELLKGDLVDIIIADEGHRLKTAKNKAGQAIKSFDTQKRIVLSGTPLQNDLSEFYFVIDLVNPGQLQKPGTFKRKYELPILRSRDDDATEEEIEEGQARFAELMELTSKFVLRRDASILAEYLPPKSEHVIFCRPTKAQSEIYKSLLQSDTFRSCIGTNQTALQLISILKKVCNSPTLLREKDSKDDAEKTDANLLSAVMAHLDPRLLKSPAIATKHQMLDQLLFKISSTTKDKVVIVSHYTATLDILSNLVTANGLSFLRLDGNTPQSKRQGLVNKFNSSDSSECFAFLLSAKSGGAGLNLIGANRLILYDIDWNPSTDAQAMARIHRDGQKKDCHIYRLLTHGALDEKIYQRQLTKVALADSVVDNRISTSTFTKDELRRLFTLDERVGCETHDVLGCQCHGRGIDVSTSTDTDIDQSNTSDENQDAKKTKGFMPSSQVNFDEMDKAERKKRAEKGKMTALMRYRHIDGSRARSAAFDRNREFSVDIDDSATSDQVEKRDEEDDNLTDDEGYRPIERFLPGSRSSTSKPPKAESLEGILNDEVLSSLVKDSESRISFIFSRTSGGAEFRTEQNGEARKGLEDFGVTRSKIRRVIACSDEEGEEE